MRKSNYIGHIVILAKLLGADCKSSAGRQGSTYTKLITRAGIPSGIIANSSYKYERAVGFGTLKAIDESYDKYGYMSESDFDKICSIFDLERDKYIVNTNKKEVEVSESDKSLESVNELVSKMDDIVDRLDSLSSKYNDLGKCIVQIMEYVKNINDDLYGGKK